jgi:ABC-type Fe3+-siderophore transport system permease subunit
VPLVLAVRVARTWGLYSPFEAPEDRATAVVRLGAIAYLALIPLAVYGFLLLRRRGAPLWIVTTPFIVVTLTTLTAYCNVRFRQAELSLLVLAGAAVDRLLHRRTSARRRAGTRAAV